MTQLQEISAAALPSALTQTKKTIPNPADWVKQEFGIHRRAPKYFRTHQIYNDSLMLMGSHELETLLNDAVRSKHKKNLHRRVSRLLSKCLIPLKFRKEHWNQSRLTPTGLKEPLKLQKTRKKLKFLTIVHAVTSLDVAKALEEAAHLKAEIIRLCKMVEGVACIGTIEVEVVSIKRIQRVVEFNNNQPTRQIASVDDQGEITFKKSPSVVGDNKRKLKLLEKLSEHITPSEINAKNGQFLIHFHGLLKVNNVETMSQLVDLMNKNPIWNKPNQVKTTLLSRTWRQIPKSIEHSVDDIVHYITKGGNCMKRKKSYLKYHIENQKNMPLMYEDYLLLNDDPEGNLTEEEIEAIKMNETENLSPYEISCLAKVINGMMNWNKFKTGYVVLVGKS